MSDASPYPLTVSVGEPDSVRQDWMRLAQLTGNVFSTWEWASAWWDHVESKQRAHIGILHGADGEIRGLVPLQESRYGPLRALRFVGHGVADQLGPVCAPEDRHVVMRAFPEMLAKLKVSWQVLIADVLPGGVDWAPLMAGRELVRERSPVVRLAGYTWNSLLAARSANFRQQVGRKERRLARRHDLRLRLVDTVDALPSALDQLFALHRARWGESSEFSRTENLHRAFAALALRRGWLRLWFLEVDGVAVAAIYGLRYGSAVSFYQSGRDPAWDRDSVGLLLLAMTIRASIDEGAIEYRLLRGGEAYKYRFADHDEGLVTVGTARTSVGVAALRLYGPVLLARAAAARAFAQRPAPARPEV